MTHGAKYQVVTNASGTLITDTTHIGHRNPIRYRGYYYDVETGLYYLQSRYYDPEVGRFISADGIMAGIGGNNNGYNLFAYCFNNPVNFIDTNGNWPKWLKYAAATVGVIVGAGTIPALASVVASEVSVHIVECTVINYVVTEVIYDMPSKEEHYNRNKNNLVPNEDELDAIVHGEHAQWDDVDDRYNKYHRFTSGTQGAEAIYNKKYMTLDGKNEVIICWDEEAGIGPYIVTDPVNMGTYNYHPGTGLGHGIEDVLPYYLWKNSPDDTTNIFERIIGN